MDVCFAPDVPLQASAHLQQLSCRPVTSAADKRGNVAAKSLASTLDNVIDQGRSQPASSQQLGRPSEGTMRRFVMETDDEENAAGSAYPARSVGVPVFVMMPLDTVSYTFPSAYGDQICTCMSICKCCPEMLVA